VQKRTTVVFSQSTFDQHGFDSRCYALTDRGEKADYVFLPYNYWFLQEHDPHLIERYVEEARKLNKPLLIDAVSDKMKDIHIPHSVVLRYAQYRSRLKENDVVIPVYAEDLLASHCKGQLVIREKKEKPRVGFVGWSSLPFFTYPKTRLKDLPLAVLGLFTTRFDLHRKGVLLRKKALMALASSPNIDANFIYRKSFSGNRKTAEKDPAILRDEFVQNIIDSDYTLCIRGDANQSTRFFEALSLGRIPIFVDTDMALPLPDLINYRDFCVFVDYRELHNIVRIVSAFHQSISPEKFKDMQRRAREVYETYLRIDAYTPFLMDILKTRAALMHTDNTQ